MMSRLTAHAESIAREAQHKRMQQMSAFLQDQGLSAQVGSDSIALSGRRLIQKWLSDPMLRFIASSGS